MPTVKLDIWDREDSELTTGISNFLLDNGTRRVVVTDVTSNHVLGYGEATLAVIDTLRLEGGTAPGQPIFHPVNPSLPCARIQLRRFGPHEFKGFVRYDKRQTTSLPHAPGIPFVNMTRGFWSTQWVRMGNQFGTSGIPNGYPSGMIPSVPPNSAAETNPDVIPRPRQREISVAVIRMMIPTVLNFNPAGQVSGAKNKVNANGLQYDGITFPTGTVRFDGLYVKGEYTVATNSTKYKVVYEFTLSPSGFFTQDVFFGEGFSLIGAHVLPSGGPAQWRTITHPAHEMTDFPQFPIG